MAEDGGGHVEIARFTAATGWAGRSITYDEGLFALEGVGQVTAADVLEYDRQGQIEWAYDGLREWVQTLTASAREAAPPVAATPAEAARPRSKMPAWAIVLIVVGGLFAVGGCAAIAIPTFLAQSDKAKESSVKEGIHSIQIAVQSHAVDNNDLFPDPELVTDDGIGRFIDHWPTNPYTDEPMTQGSGAGDFLYEVTDDRESFRLTGYGQGGREAIVVGF